MGLRGRPNDGILKALKRPWAWMETSYLERFEILLLGEGARDGE